MKMLNESRLIKVNGKSMYIRYFYLESKDNKNDYIGKTFETKSFGKVLVIGVCEKTEKKKKYLIQFMDTLNYYKSDGGQLKKGQIRDVYKKTVYGVGYLGDKNYSNMAKETSMWRDMISRCYNVKDQRYNSYGKIGMRVDERWHSLSTFLSDIKQLENYEKYVNSNRKYNLDKDKKQLNIPKEKRMYSKETCCFITAKENIKYRFIEENNIFKAIDPNGVEYFHYNQSEFSRMFNLNQGHVTQCMNKTRNHHKNFKFEIIKEFPKGWNHYNCSEKCIERRK